MALTKNNLEVPVQRQNLTTLGSIICAHRRQMKLTIVIRFQKRTQLQLKSSLDHQILQEDGIWAPVKKQAFMAILEIYQLVCRLA